MNRSLKILTLLLFFASNFAQAQNSMFELGLEGGPNLNTFRIHSYSYSDVRPKIYGSGGLIFQYNTRKILSLKTGFSYQRKGFEGVSPLPGGTGVYTASYDYITLPLLVKASFGKKTRLFINAGPYFGFLMAGKYDFKANTPDGVFHNSGSIDLSSYKQFDLGITSGIGVAVPIKEAWMIHLEIRNYFGFVNIRGQVKGGTEIHTNTTDLRVGFVYKLGFYEE